MIFYYYAAVFFALLLELALIAVFLSIAANVKRIRELIEIVHRDVIADADQAAREHRQREQKMSDEVSIRTGPIAGRMAGLRMPRTKLRVTDRQPPGSFDLALACPHCAGELDNATLQPGLNICPHCRKSIQVS